MNKNSMKIYNVIYNSEIHKYCIKCSELRGYFKILHRNNKYFIVVKKTLNKYLKKL